MYNQTTVLYTRILYNYIYLYRVRSCRVGIPYLVSQAALVEIEICICRNIAAGTIIIQIESATQEASLPVSTTYRIYSTYDEPSKKNGPSVFILCMP